MSTDKVNAFYINLKVEHKYIHKFKEYTNLKKLNSYCIHLIII